MSARVDKLCDRLRSRLDALELRVDFLKDNVQALPGKAEKALQDTIHATRAKIQAQQEVIEKSRADLKAWGEQKKTETEAMIQEWKATREIQKLNSRADRAEAYAEAATVVALACIDEAEEAMLQAALARMEAGAALESRLSSCHD